MDKDNWNGVIIFLCLVLMVVFGIFGLIQKFSGDDSDKYIPNTENNNSSNSSGSNPNTYEYNKSNSNSSSTESIEASYDRFADKLLEKFSNSSSTANIETSSPISIENATQQYVERYGSVYVQINVNIKSLTNKFISKVGFSIYFRDKNYSESDVTAPSIVEYIDGAVSLLGNNTRSDVELLILEPNNKNMVCSTVSVYRVYYTDGTVENVD